MRTETVSAETEEQAFDLCPWACEVREVAWRTSDQKEYICFESQTDADIYDNQI